MAAKYKRPIMTAERTVNPYQNPYTRPVAQLPQVIEVKGFVLGSDTSKVYETLQQAEQAALHKYLFNIVASYSTHDGLDWDDLVLHLKENEVERKAFIKFLTNMDGS